jgi:hypothetical protein
MAKQELKAVEKQLEAETGHDVVQTGANPPTFVETDKALKFVESEPKPDSGIHGKPQERYIVDEAGKTLTVFYDRLGYAPRRVPAGWREATEDEIAAHKKGQK